MEKAVDSFDWGKSINIMEKDSSPTISDFDNLEEINKQIEEYVDSGKPEKTIIKLTGSYKDLTDEEYKTVCIYPKGFNSPEEYLKSLKK